MENKNRINLVHKPNSFRTDLLIIIIILIASLKFTFGLEKILDIGLYDESNYLYWGIKLRSIGIPAADGNPLYVIWYFIISLFESNRISLYYLNYKLQTILPPVFAYILLRRNRVSIPISFIISWSLLISVVNAYTWPKVSHLALLVTLFIFILVGQIRSLLWASFCTSIGTLFVLYVRPEYFLAYQLSLLLCILIFVLEYRKQKRFHLTGLTVYAIISLLLMGVFGLPIAGNRVFFAFGQHFSLNWVLWTRSSLNPWTNWQEILTQNFGSAQSIWDASVNNPSVFLRHITYNVWLLKKSFLLVLPTIFPIDKLSGGMAVLSVLGLCVPYISNIRKNFLEHRNILILSGPFLIPGIFSVVVIYPREHYILLPCVLTIVLMAILMDSHTLKQKQLSYKQIFLLGSLMIALTPYFVVKAGVNQPNLKTIRLIQSLRIESPVDLLEAEGGYNIYLGDNFQRVAEYDKDTNFDRFLQMRNINMIVVTDKLLKDSRFRDDTEWHNFLLDYPAFGFLRMNVPDTDRKLFIRSDILHR